MPSYGPAWGIASVCEPVPIAARPGSEPVTREQVADGVFPDDQARGATELPDIGSRGEVHLGQHNTGLSRGAKHP